MRIKREQVIDRDPENMGGTPVFTGTRVPVQTLIDYLSGGKSLDDFLDGLLDGLLDTRKMT